MINWSAYFLTVCFPEDKEILLRKMGSQVLECARHSGRAGIVLLIIGFNGFLARTLVLGMRWGTRCSSNDNNIITLCVLTIAFLYLYSLGIFSTNTTNL